MRSSEIARPSLHPASKKSARVPSPSTASVSNASLPYILRLQQTLGNHAVQRFLETGQLGETAALPPSTRGEQGRASPSKRGIVPVATPISAVGARPISIQRDTDEESESS